MSTNEGKHSRGYWMSVGISAGVGIGAALGVALENIGAGIALGVAIGAGIGASLEQKNKDKIRPLTEQEKKMQKWGVALGLVIPLILVGLFFIILSLRIR
jgi:F0F1-type ATP synthase membrane subunit c/vacuolar-type H+-ATPase subunit K